MSAGGVATMERLATSDASMIHRTSRRPASDLRKKQQLRTMNGHRSKSESLEVGSSLSRWIGEDTTTTTSVGSTSSIPALNSPARRTSNGVGVASSYGSHLSAAELVALGAERFDVGEYSRAMDAFKLGLSLLDVKNPVPPAILDERKRLMIRTTPVSSSSSLDASSSSTSSTASSGVSSVRGPLSAGLEDDAMGDDAAAEGRSTASPTAPLRTTHDCPTEEGDATKEGAAGATGGEGGSKGVKATARKLFRRRKNAITSLFSSSSSRDRKVTSSSSSSPARRSPSPMRGENGESRSKSNSRGGNNRTGDRQFAATTGLVRKTSMDSSCDSPSSQDLSASRGAAQSLDKGQYMHQRNEYDEGLDCFPRARSVSFGDSFGEDRRMDRIMVVSTLLLNVGKVYQKREDHNLNEALLAYRQGLKLINRVPILPRSARHAHLSSDVTDIKVELLHGIGQILYYRAEHGESLASYREALTVLRESVDPMMDRHPEGLTVACTLNCIGVIQYHMSNSEQATDQALDNLNKALNIQKSLLGPTSLEVATTLNNIGRIYFQRGEYDDSMVAYGEALRIRRMFYGADHLDVAATVFNTGQSHHQRGNLDEALTLYEEFARVASRRLGPDHRDMAIVTTCIAQIHHEGKDHDAAMRLYGEALRIGKASLGEFHPEIAITYNKIGNLLYEKGSLDEAIKAYHDGLRVERKVLEPGNPNVVVTLTNIAEIYKQKGEYEKAMENYKEALKLQEQRAGGDSAEVASTLNSIGTIHFQREEYLDALDCYQEALRLRREKLGDDHVDVASTLTNVGLVLLKKGMQDFAIQVFMEALRIRRATYGDVHREVAFTMFNLATIFHQRGDNDQAIRFYTRTVQLERAALGEDHPDVGITLYQIGQLRCQCGELDEALDAFREALRLERRALGCEHPSVARTLNEIGNIQLQRGETEEAMESFTEALRIFQKKGLSADSVAVNGLNLYGYSRMHPEAAGAA